MYMGKKLLLAAAMAAIVSGSALLMIKAQAKSNSKAWLLTHRAASLQTALIKKSTWVK